MQAVDALEAHEPEHHPAALRDVLGGQLHDLRKRAVVRALHVLKVDRGLVHEQLERLGRALGRGV